jgi:hypothetical protein
VKKRISRWGRPATPNTKASPSDSVSAVFFRYRPGLR